MSMMLHRHGDKPIDTDVVTKLADVAPKVEAEVVAETTTTTKRAGRPKKSES
jgi:hypothetical protein